MSEMVNERDGRLVAEHRPGSGTPIVLVHGVMADAAAWRGVAAALAPDRPLLVPNRRGRAPSAGCGPDYSIQTEVDDLRSWIDRLQGPVDLVGHSYGGLIAVEAARQGAPVRSLTLYEPVVRPFAEDALPAIRRAAATNDLDRLVELVNIDVSGYSAEHVEALRRTGAWRRLRELAAPLAAEMAAVASFHPDVPGWSAMDVPVTLVAGELSASRSPYGDALDRFRQVFPAARSVVLPGQDHLGHVTAPSLLGHVIGAELDEHPRDPLAGDAALADVTASSGRRDYSSGEDVVDRRGGAGALGQPE